MASDEDRFQTRAMVARRVTLFAAVLALAGAVGVIVYGVVLIRGTQNTNEPKIDNTATTLAAVQQTLTAVQGLAVKINSCTDPAGECARRGQRSTAAAVGNIKSDTRDVVVAALVCQAQGVKGFEAIVRCADASLAAHRGDR